jgi:predicted transcriptional regulator with HTH domain
MTPRRQQAGITAIGFVVLALVFGVIGLALLKIVPLYMDKMTVASVLSDIERDGRSGGQTVQGILTEIERRLTVESINIPRDNVKITQVRDGFQVRIQQEARAQFLGDLWFVIVIDEQVEIQR